MEVRALINIRFVMRDDIDYANLLRVIRQINKVDWASLAFGPQADAVAHVTANNQNEIAMVAVKINQVPGVGGTATQILADL